MNTDRIGTLIGMGYRDQHWYRDTERRGTRYDNVLRQQLTSLFDEKNISVYPGGTANVLPTANV